MAKKTAKIASLLVSAVLMMSVFAGCSLSSNKIETTSAKKHKRLLMW